VAQSIQIYESPNQLFSIVRKCWQLDKIWAGLFIAADIQEIKAGAGCVECFSPISKQDYLIHWPERMTGIKSDRFPSISRGEKKKMLTAEVTPCRQRHVENELCQCQSVIIITWSKQVCLTVIINSPKCDRRAYLMSGDDMVDPQVRVAPPITSKSKVAATQSPWWDAPESDCVFKAHAVNVMSFLCVSSIQSLSSNNPSNSYWSFVVVVMLIPVSPFIHICTLLFS